MKARSLKIISIVALAIVLSSFIQFSWILAADVSSGRPSSIAQAGPSTELALNITLNGAGATFPAPLISTWATQYHLTHPNVTISYASVGSGAGQSRLVNKTVDFGASDAPLSTAQRPLYPNILHIPETVGSVTASYDLPGIGVGLNFTGAVLANIYLGNIVTWNDAAIQSLNPHTVLPNQNIMVAHRSDSSGTTFVWTSFLCLDSSTWCAVVGKGTTVNWPVGVGASGNAGVANYVVNTPYALGYVELNYALSNGLTYGAIQNPSSFYITPSLASTNYAVGNSTSSLPPGNGDWSSVSLLNAPGIQTYPIASFTYFLIYKELNVVPSMNNVEAAQARELIRFLNWVITTGQTFSTAQSYVPLHPNVVAIDQASINSITYTINSTPASHTFFLSADSSSGWNLTQPGPTLSVTSGDTITLMLISHDGASHQWYIDWKNNGAVDSNESWTESPPFSSSTNTPFTFTPVIWSQTSLPSAGSFTYSDALHPSITGTIQVYQQQVAGVFIQPSTSLTTSTRPVIDSSRGTTVGSLLIDTRRQTVSGNVTVAIVDKTSGSLTFAKVFVIPSLALIVQFGSPVRQLRFILVGSVLPYSVSSNILVQYQAANGGTTLSVGMNSFSRDTDLASNGYVSLIDAGIVYAQFGKSSGDPGFNPLADMDGNGSIGLIDAGIVAANFGATAFS